TITAYNAPDTVPPIAAGLQAPPVPVPDQATRLLEKMNQLLNQADESSQSTASSGHYQSAQAPVQSPAGSPLSRLLRRANAPALRNVPTGEDEGTGFDLSGGHLVIR